MKKLKQVTKFIPAFDRRDPDPKKNYGIGSVRVYMILVGEKGAVQFVFSTGMYLPKTHSEWLPKFGYNKEPYMGMDVGYHSPVPKYEGQGRMDHCDVLKGGCYYDGSGLEAEKYMDVLVKDGSDKVWKLLEKEYKRLFG